MKRWAALLRAVNVGGAKLAMADLRAMLEAMGYAEVRTLLASGNAVFDADVADPEALERLLEDAGARALGFRTSYLVRDAGALAALVKANPFPQVAAERPGQLVVHFWRGTPPADLPDRIAASYDGPERVAVAGNEVFVDYPEGQGRSELGPAIKRLKLGEISTARNWNTVLKLRDAVSA